MGWAKFDDKRHTSTKLAAAGLAANGLDANGITWCAANETDGYVDLGALLFIAPGMATNAATKVALALVRVGRWHEWDDYTCACRKDAPPAPGPGWVIHDYLRFNLSHDDLEAKRDKERQRKAAFVTRQEEARTRGRTPDSARKDAGSDASSDHPDPSPPVPTRPYVKPPQPPAATTLAVVETNVVPQAEPIDKPTQVFLAWCESTGRDPNRTRLDPKRRKAIASALKAYPLGDVVDAVQGWKHSPHHRGENERQTIYNDLSVLLRDASQVEKFRDLQRQHGESPARFLPQRMSGINSLLGGS